MICRSALVCILSFVLFGQHPVLPPRETPPGSPTAPSGYVLGPDDQLLIRALEVEEIRDTIVQLDMSGNIRLPLARESQPVPRLLCADHFVATFGKYNLNEFDRVQFIINDENQAVAHVLPAAPVGRFN